MMHNVLKYCLLIPAVSLCAAACLFPEDTKIELDRYTLAAGPIRVKNAAEGISGITFNPETHSLFLLPDHSSSIPEISLRGGLKGAYVIDCFKEGSVPYVNPERFVSRAGTGGDTEGIVYMEGNMYAIASEGSGQICIVEIDSTATAVNPEKVKRIPISSKWRNAGLEGVAYDPDKKVFYGVKEFYPRKIFRVAGDAYKADKPTFTELWDAEKESFGLRDFSDVYFHRETGHLLLLSQLSRCVVECTTDGKEISRLWLKAGKSGLERSITDAEGITMDSEGRVYIGNEGTGDQLYVFQKPGTPDLLKQAKQKFTENPLPAFPGAEGFGAIASGGRGGKVIHVTNLNSSGPGSFQWACSQKGPRIIVFDVGGVIVPKENRSSGKTWVSVKPDNVTIAGQTAPSPGITVKGLISIQRADFTDKDESKKGRGSNVDNVIMRFLRARPFATGGRGSNLNGIELGPGRKVIVDHLSISWHLDDGWMLYPSPYIYTVQWCTGEESDIHLEGGDEPHNFGVKIYGGGPWPLSIHHNLFAHHHERVPDCGGYPLDWRNNVLYNIGRIGGVNILGNTVGCYCRRGPGALIGYSRAYFPPCTAAPYTSSGGRGKKGRYYVAGNYLEPWGGYDETWQMKGDPWYDKVAETPFSAPPVETHTAEEAYELVCAHAGCLPRDPVTQRTIRDVRTQTGSAGMKVPDGGLTEGMETGELPKDTDRDGMPDEWEKSHELDPGDPQDSTGTVPAGASPGNRHKGYTYIEYYINELADIKIAEAITEFRLETELPEPWDKPAKGLSPAAMPHKSLEEMIQAISEQTEAKGNNTSPGWYAVQQLSHMGENAKPAVPELVRILKESNTPRRASFAAWALGAIGPAAAEAVPALIDGLSKKYTRPEKIYKAFYVKGFISWALGKIGPEAKEAVPALADVLENGDIKLKGWGYGNSITKRAAAWALSRMGSEAEKAMPALLNALEKKHGGEHTHSSETLARIGKPALPGVIKLLSSRYSTARKAACRTLGLMGSEAGEAADELAKLLSDKSSAVRTEAARALGKMRAHSGNAVEALAAALQDKKYGVRHAAAKALGHIGPGAAKASEPLEKALEDEKKEVRRSAALALGRIGPEAADILNRVLENNKDPLVRKYAARALGSTGKKGVPFLMNLLTDADAEVRREAIWSLGRINAPAKKAVPLLQKAKNDEDYIVRIAAAKVLERLEEEKH